ncbi:MAG: DUF1822 family protein [Oscillatoria sp. SIO1A7]|nr:DUF1822 family protein [Oscillatoria sp. SIO1A7]
MVNFHEKDAFLSEPLRLPLGPETMDEARDEFERHPNNAGWTAYINRLCLDVVISWLRQFTVEEPRPDLLICWEFLNGAAIDCGATRVVLVPYQIPQNEPFIPQEWVDIPIFAADYYLVCGVDLDEEGGWVHLKGYVSHWQLKNYGGYDSERRGYYTNLKELKTEEELLMLLAAVRLGPRSPRAEISPLLALNRQRAEVLLNQLSNTDIIAPWLEISFAEWAALLANDRWRRRLYELRTSRSAAAKPASLLERLLKAGWQTAEEILETQYFAFSLRSINDSTSLGKFVDLGTQIRGSVLLMVTLTPENGETDVRLKVFPTREKHLPPNLQLLVLDEDGDVFMEATSQNADNSIQLQDFGGESGDRCKIKVILGSASFSEEITF